MVATNFAPNLTTRTQTSLRSLTSSQVFHEIAHNRIHAAGELQFAIATKQVSYSRISNIAPRIHLVAPLNERTREIQKYLKYLKRMFWFAQFTLLLSIASANFFLFDVITFFSEGTWILHPILSIYLFLASISIAAIAHVSLIVNLRYMRRAMEKLQ